MKSLMIVHTVMCTAPCQDSLAALLIRYEKGEERVALGRGG